MIFGFSDHWPLYLGFTLFILLLLALDLGVFHRRAHEVSLREAGAWSAVWVGLALAFNLGLYFYVPWMAERDPALAAQLGDVPAAASRLSLEFLTGYLLEKALAVDNIFVFLLVLSYFGVPKAYQHRVLFFGILGALVFRIAFIALGSVLMRYHAVIVAFGILLVLTGLKTLFAREKPIDPGRNPLVRLARRFLPIAPELHGDRFFVRRGSVWMATPLFLALVFLEASDVIFALDSVPAIFAVTEEPFLVYTSNIFAILGLRSMFFLVAGVIGKLRFLRHGLGLILVFVGLKMAWLNGAFGGKFPISWSLGVIAAILAGAIAASLLAERRSRTSRGPSAPFPAASPRPRS
jgi:tellurite resistance protein TerC